MVSFSMSSTAGNSASQRSQPEPEIADLRGEKGLLKGKTYSTLENMPAEIFGKIATFVPKNFLNMMYVSKSFGSKLSLYTPSFKKDILRRNTCLALANKWNWSPRNLPSQRGGRKLMCTPFVLTENIIQEMEEIGGKSQKDILKKENTIFSAIQNLAKLASLEKIKGSKKEGPLYKKIYQYLDMFIESIPLGGILTYLAENAEINLKSINKIVDKILKKLSYNNGFLWRFNEEKECLNALIAFAERQPKTERQEAIAALDKAYKILEQNPIKHHFFDVYFFYTKDYIFLFTKILILYIDLGVDIDFEKSFQYYEEIHDKKTKRFSMHYYSLVLLKLFEKKQEKIQQNKINEILGSQFEYIEKELRQDSFMLAEEVSYTFEFWIHYSLHLRKDQDERVSNIYKGIVQYICEYLDAPDNHEKARTLEKILIKLNKAKIRQFFAHNTTKGKSWKGVKHTVLKKFYSIIVCEIAKVLKRVSEQLLLESSLRFAEENGTSNPEETKEALDDAYRIAYDEYKTMDFQGRRSALTSRHGRDLDLELLVQQRLALRDTLITIAKGKAKIPQSRQEAYEILEQLVINETSIIDTYTEIPQKEIEALEELASISLSCYLIA